MVVVVEVNAVKMKMSSLSTILINKAVIALYLYLLI